MATQSAVFSFALPEDEDSDQLLIKSSTTENGTYSTDATVAYEYGTITHEFDTLDDTKWYKIQFNNSVDSEAGPDSAAVYGGDFSKAAPFLAISTGTDGANYASIQDVYDYSTLTTSDVTNSRVSQALRRARAVIDLKTATLDIDRFSRSFTTSTTRKKFNAALRIIKEAEINIALGNVYRGMSDDLVVRDAREALSGANARSESVKIGDTTLSEKGRSTETLAELKALSATYLRTGRELIDSLQPTSIRLHFEADEITRSPKFRLPFNGF